MRTPSRSRTAGVLALGLAAIGVCAGAAGPAAADQPAAASGRAAAAAPGGWHRYHAQPFTEPAGALCPFAVRSAVLFDREYVRTTQRYADGSPRVQEFVGPLVVRVTNRASGKSVARDLSGRAVLHYFRSGGFDFAMQGPVAVGFHPGDSRPPGYYVLRGEHTVRFAADGTRTVLVDRGSEEDLCHTLAR